MIYYLASCSLLSVGNKSNFILIKKTVSRFLSTAMKFLLNIYLIVTPYSL